MPQESCGRSLVLRKQIRRDKKDLPYMMMVHTTPISPRYDPFIPFVGRSLLLPCKEFFGRIGVGWWEARRPPPDQTSPSHVPCWSRGPVVAAYSVSPCHIPAATMGQRPRWAVKALAFVISEYPPKYLRLLTKLVRAVAISGKRRLLNRSLRQ